MPRWALSSRPALAAGAFLAALRGDISFAGPGDLLRAMVWRMRNGIYTPETACLFLAESSANISHRFLQRAQRAQRLTARLTAL